MKCQDIAEILDNRSLARLTSMQRNEIEDHLEGCQQCARDWRLHGEFAALPDMVMPEGFQFRCRTLVASGPQADRGQRARRRFILIGAVAAVAAAAAMLVWSLRDGTGGRATAAVQSQAPMAMGQAVEAEPVNPVNAGVQPAIRQAETPAEKVIEERPRFAVHILPLINEGKDAYSVAAIAAFYTALLDQLRVVPGLDLIRVESKDNAPTGPDVRVLTILGSVSSPNSSVSVLVGMNVVTGPGGTMSGQYLASLRGSPAPDCTAVVDGSVCFDPATMAQEAVDGLRARVFPFDPALMQEARSRLLDPALDSRTRFNALLELGTLGRQRADSAGGTRVASNVLHEPDVIRGLIELVAVTNDAGNRAEIWRGLRGAATSELLRPLIEAARTDPDKNVRAQATATLGADYVNDPRARIALETNVREDSSTLVRGIALRGLNGEDAWKKHVRASLRDAGMPAAERVAALLHHGRLPSPPGSHSMAPWSAFDEILDEDTTAALVNVLPEAFAQSGERDRSDLFTFTTTLAARSRHPAVTRMLLDAIEGRLAWYDKRMALRSIRLHSEDPAIHAALQRIAAEDQDAQLRMEARRLLGEPVPPQ